MNIVRPESADDIYSRFYRALAGIVVVGVIMNAIVSWRNDAGFFSPGYNRALNSFAFFTIQSNILVGISALLLSFNRFRKSTFFAAFWCSSLVGITITGIVYHWLLSETYNPHGLALIGDLIVHSAVPILAVLGFFVFGPRGLLTPTIVKYSLVYLGLWGIFTIIRGEIVNWYPYPFINVIDKGYPRVIVNGIGMAVLYLAVGFGYLLLDRLMTDEKAIPTKSAA
jgi:hypothetical protein